MTARIVIYSLAPHRASQPPKFHRESIIPGLPDCGTVIRNWTRAFAVDDTRLCRDCWPDVAQAVA